MPNGDSVKKIINNGAFIAHLAPLLDGPEAKALATAAQTHAAILESLGIKTPAADFRGCDQAQKLLAWIRGDEKPDGDLMNAWTADIWSAIADLAAGKIPGAHPNE